MKNSVWRHESSSLTSNNESSLLQKKSRISGGTFFLEQEIHNISHFPTSKKNIVLHEHRSHLMIHFPHASTEILPQKRPNCKNNIVSHTEKYKNNVATCPEAKLLNATPIHPSVW